MAARKLLRIVLALIVLVLLTLRVSRQWRYESHWWLAGSSILAFALLALIVYMLVSMFRKPRLPRDEVPKNPLGLE